MYIYTYNLQDALINTFHDSSFSPCSIGIQIWAIDSPIGDPLCAFLPDGASRYKPLSLIGACLTSEVDIVHSSTLLSIFTGIGAVYRSMEELKKQFLSSCPVNFACISISGPVPDVADTSIDVADTT